jgi:hypothetical protein
MRLVDSFYMEMCIAPLQERRSRVRSHEQRLVLVSQLQAMMEKETNNLDRMISVLAVVGLFLLLLCAWSGYQLYRSTKRADWSQCHESRRTPCPGFACEESQEPTKHCKSREAVGQ